MYGTDEERLVRHAGVARCGPETGGAVVHHVDITDRKLYEQQLARQALRDPLTGLANRALLSDRLDGSARAVRVRGPPSVGLLLLDLDRFNHRQRRSRPRRPATTCSWPSPPGSASSSAPGATVARLGGDEFVVLCEGSRSDQVPAALAERIVDTRSANRSVHVDGEPLTVTMSIGVALGNRTTSGDDLLRRCRRRHAPRQATTAATDSSSSTSACTPRAFTRLSVEAELRRAIERDEFRLYYQPIVEMRSGRGRRRRSALALAHPTPRLC